MNSIFNLNSAKCIYINGYPYLLHDFVIRKLNMFALLFDSCFDQQEIRIEIDNYDSKMIDEIFKSLYNSPEMKLLPELSDNMKQLSLMMYFGMDENITGKYAREISNTDDIIQSLVEMPHQECFNMVINYYYDDTYVNDVIIYAYLIKEKQCPESFKIKFISKLVAESIWITGPIDVYDPDTKKKIHGKKSFNWDINVSREKVIGNINNVEKIYKTYGIICQSAKLIYNEKNSIDKIIVNEKKLNLIKDDYVTIISDHDDYRTANMIRCDRFGNIFKPTIGTHIAKILLGIETV